MRDLIDSDTIACSTIIRNQLNCSGWIWFYNQFFKAMIPSYGQTQKNSPKLSMSYPTRTTNANKTLPCIIIPQISTCCRCLTRHQRQKHQKGALLQIIYQKGALLQLFSGGSVFLLQSAPQTGACTVHVTRGTAGSAPDASAFGSAQGSGTTGGAPAAGATASAGQPGA